MLTWIGRWKIVTKHLKKESSMSNWYKIQKLDDSRVRNAFNVELRNKFDILSNAADQDDHNFRGI
jgi:hypothetical protein